MTTKPTPIEQLRKNHENYERYLAEQAMTTQQEDQAREQFVIEQQDALSYVVLYKGQVVNEFTDRSDAEEWADFWAGEIEAGRLAGLEQAAKIAEHFANDELTAEEFPPHGVVSVGQRYDSGIGKRFCDAVATAIREAGGVSKNNGSGELLAEATQSTPDKCPTCGSTDKSTRFTSHFAGVPIQDCQDEWHASTPKGSK